MQLNPIQELHTAVLIGNGCYMQFIPTLASFFQTIDETEILYHEQCIDALSESLTDQTTCFPVILNDLLEAERNTTLIPVEFNQSRLSYIGTRAIKSSMFTNIADWEKVLFKMDKNSLTPIFIDLRNTTLIMSEVFQRILGEYKECYGDNVKVKLIIEDSLRLNDSWTNFTTQVRVLYILFHIIYNETEQYTQSPTDKVVPLRRKN